MLNKDHKSADFVYLFAEKFTYRFFTNIFYVLPITPNQITLINFFINNLGAVVSFSLGKYWANLLGVIFLISAAVFDWMDGAIARKKSLSSKGGAFLDPALDFIWQHLLIAGIALGIYLKTSSLFWLIFGFLTLVSLIYVNYMGAIFENKFGFGFRGDYDDFNNLIDKSKKASFFDKFCQEILTYRKFSYIFFFTLRYPLLLGAIFNQLGIFLVFLCLTSLIRGTALFYLYFTYLESEKKNNKSLIIEALKERKKYWIAYENSIASKN
jgi:phosphatidylglycerophosphate synthase